MENINYYKRGLSKFEIQDYEGAIEYFTRAIELDANNANLYNKRGYAKLCVSDRSASDDFIKGAEIVIAECSKTIENVPTNSNAYCKRGRAKKQLAEYNDAKIDFSKAIELDPNNSDLYLNRALLIQETDDFQNFKDAIADCTTAIGLMDDKALGYCRRGDIKKMMEDFKGAIEDYSMAINHAPTNHRYYIRRWTVRNMYGDLDGASEDIIKMEELTNNFENI